MQFFRQKRVQAELDEQLEPGQLINYADRLRLPYTEAVILEASRLMPVVPLGLPHYAQHDAIIDLKKTSTRRRENGKIFSYGTVRIFEVGDSACLFVDQRYSIEQQFPMGH